MSGHVSQPMLRAYRTTASQLDDEMVVSLENHVMSCQKCRSRLGQSTPADEIERSWAAVVDELGFEFDHRVAGLQRSSRRAIGGGRRLALAAACIALVALGVLMLAARRESPQPAAPTLPSGFVDLGSVGDLTPGETRWFEQNRLFLVRTDAEYLVLSHRSPTRGCRLAAGEDLDSDISGNETEFADPCHGATFALDGTRLGGPAKRGMYRYRFEVVDDRIVADTRLIVPGPLAAQSAVDVEPPNPGPGIVDSLALRWLDAADSAVEAVRNGNAGPFLWPLGAFHDTSNDVVTVYMTVGENPLTLQIGTIETLDTFAERDLDGFEVLRAHPVCADLWADTPATVVSCQESVGYLNVVAALDDPAHVVAELYAPNGGDRVVVVTLDEAPSDGGVTTTSVLLHVVEALDGGSP